MQANNPDIHSMDAVLDNLYGAVGSPEREEFRREAYAYMMGQLICDARKQEKLTQSQLAQKVGTDKTYISRIEKGLIENKSFAEIGRIIGKDPSTVSKEVRLHARIKERPDPGYTNPPCIHRKRCKMTCLCEDQCGTMCFPARLVCRAVFIGTHAQILLLTLFGSAFFIFSFPPRLPQKGIIVFGQTCSTRKKPIMKGRIDFSHRLWRIQNGEATIGRDSE